MNTYRYRLLRQVLLTASLAALLANSTAANIIKDVKMCDVRTSENEVFTNAETCQEVNIDPEGFTLEHTVILSRHTIRGPAKVDDKLLREDNFPLGLGYSTTTGNGFSVKVGEIWRKFYGDFAKNTTVRQIWARSSSYVRCAETQQLVLSKMFPPEGQYDFGYPIQPIVTIKVPIGNDVNVETCDVPAPQSLPHLNDLVDPALTVDGFANFGEFVQFISDKTGYLANETEYYEPVIDGLYCTRYDQQPIPDWAEEKWSSMDFAMRKLSYDYWINEIPYYGNYIGKFLADRLAGSASGQYKEKFSFFSYHDTSIQAVLKALGNDPTELYPSFLGALHLQVYRRNSDGETFVRAMFHQGATKDLDYANAKEITLKKCPFPECSVKDLAELLSHIYDDVDRSICAPINLRALL